MTNTYDKGRLNLPFVGIATFGKRPYAENWAERRCGDHRRTL
jgi:agmatinase